MNTHLRLSLRNRDRRRSARALALSALLSSCSSSTEARFDWAHITLISGANQTVTVNPSGLTDVPELIVVRVDSLGTPLAGAEVQVTAHMNGAPGPNGPQSFYTGSDGIAAMQISVSNIKGPVGVTAAYVRCSREGLFGCEAYSALATVSVPGIVAQ